jgi:hypothetical protein
MTGPRKPETAKDAVILQARAAVKREIADHMTERGDYHAIIERDEADEMDQAASKFLDIGSHTLHVTGPVKPGNGGEMLVVTRELQADVPGTVDTVREKPSMLAAEASEARVRFAGESVVMAVDAAESIKARNSLEKMLAHQMAAAHRVAMLFAGHAERLLKHTAPDSPFGPIKQAYSVEAARMANAMARSMSAYQDGMVAFDRIRRGGKQTVRVVHQHVAVGPGGQAVVAAGGVKGGGHRTTRGRGRK